MSARPHLDRLPVSPYLAAVAAELLERRRRGVEEFLWGPGPDLVIIDDPVWAEPPSPQMRELVGSWWDQVRADQPAVSGLHQFRRSAAGTPARRLACH